MHQINKKFPYLLPSIMWLLCVLFYGYQYLLQVSPGVMAQDLMRDFHINATHIGNLAACYFYAYTFMQIPVGIILDRFGVRRPLNAAVLVCVLGSFLFAASSYFGVTILGRTLIGLGGSFAVVSTLYIAASWLPTRIFTFLLGTTVTFGMLGAMFGQAPLAMMVDALSWRSTMFIFTAIGLLIFLFTWRMIYDLPKKQIQKTSLVTQKKSIIYGLKNVIKNRQIWLLAIYGGLIFMPISVVGSLWGTPFLMQKYGITNTAASSVITMLFVGLAIGSPLIGWISDYLNRRKIIMLISACGALTSIFFVIYPHLPLPAVGAALFAFGFFTGGGFVCFNAAREMDNTQSTGATMGFMNTLNMVGGALGQPLIGLFLDWRWQGAMDHGVRVYSTADFQIALTSLPIGIFCAILIMLLTKVRN